jgi:hypothetical protein
VNNFSSILDIFFYATNILCTVHCTVGTSDFDAQMSGVKIKKDDEFLRPVYKKPFSKILSSCFHFDFFLVHKKYTLTLL